MLCFVHFDLEMCFAPQRRALFRHRNFQKWFEPLVFLTCWHRNFLRATTACTFSTSQLPKVVRHCGVLYILTSKCASRHNGVHFFDISTSKSGPMLVCFVHFDLEMCNYFRTRRFSEPTFRPSGASNHWKNSVSRLSYLFAHLHLLSSDSFSSTLLSSNLSLLSALLCFSSVHIVGSLTSKLPSMTSICTGNAKPDKDGTAISHQVISMDPLHFIQESFSLPLWHFYKHSEAKLLPFHARAASAQANVAVHLDLSFGVRNLIITYFSRLLQRICLQRFFLSWPVLPNICQSLCRKSPETPATLQRVPGWFETTYLPWQPSTLHVGGLCHSTWWHTWQVFLGPATTWQAAVGRSLCGSPQLEVQNCIRNPCPWHRHGLDQGSTHWITLNIFELARDGVDKTLVAHNF